jgi:predicted AAA+ superfamily ATPase
LEGSERGFLLETWVLHELRAAVAYGNTGGDLRYWRTPSGSEVDFVWTRGRRSVGIEVKASSTWRSEYGTVLKSLLLAGNLDAGYGVYDGSVELKDGPLRVLPIASFFRTLAGGDIIG